jgi:predicted Ser/Thr protein kinase
MTKGRNIAMDETKKALESLKTEIENKEKRTILSFEGFLELTRTEPERVLRNIFQLFHDMVKTYVGEGIDEYPDDPESIGYVKYDCSKIFVEGADNPFFADRLFANRFVRQVESLRQGSQQNRIYVYEGPHGCGKSTFLNNLLRTFEEYTNTREGQSFEILWEIEINENDKFEVPCPSHDHPILIIPKNYRANFLDELLPDGMTEIKYKLSSEKEYEWVFREEVCTICKSLLWALFDKFGSFNKVLGHVKVRPYKFDRSLGEGISVFNPGDKPIKEFYLTDRQIQEKLDQVFGANRVKYVFSPHAKTNNGIYALMDIKSHNRDRLLELHNVISEGVHKVNGIVEERINSLFIALMNPEDKKDIEEEVKMESFQGRIQYSKIPYVMEVPTEVKIYRSIFGKQIDEHFLPRVLENFARVIISSRMNQECQPLEEWIGDMQKYEKYCDRSGLLLRMEIYAGVIPAWLSEEDKRKFTAKVRQALISEGEKEGKKGFSGRDSIRLFGEFFSRYGSKPNLINMGHVTDYFKYKIGKNQRDDHIPKNFIDSLVNWYDYEVLNEVKEALYFYNKKQISEDILNYLCVINYNLGDEVKCRWTQKKMEVTIEFLKLIGSYITGEEMQDQEALDFAQDVQRRYTKIIAQDQNEITKTELYQELFDSYIRNLKEKVFKPVLENENFLEAVKSFGTKEFETFDTRLKEHIVYMIKNLVNKFGYTEQGAKEICLYTVEQKLVEKFAL